MCRTRVHLLQAFFEAQDAHILCHASDVLDDG